MSWFYLILAGLFEIVWAIAMKQSMGFSKFWPSAVTIGGMVVSVWLLALALRHLPIGTAYAAWTGIGAAGTVIAGMMFFHEPVSALRIVCLLLILVGIVGLKLAH